MKNIKKIVILGASGHGLVVADIAVRLGYEIKAFLDDNISNKSSKTRPILGGIDSAAKIHSDNNDMEFVIAIGNNDVRKKIYEKFPHLNYAKLIHPSAVVADSAKIGRGTVVMAGVIVNPAAIIGRHCILNTSCVVEHENNIGNFAHISPRAVLGGNVCVGECSLVGIGACVRNNLKIAPNVIVGAGAAVVGDIAESGTYIGVPAKRMQNGA